MLRIQVVHKPGGSQINSSLQVPVFDTPQLFSFVVELPRGPKAHGAEHHTHKMTHTSHRSPRLHDRTMSPKSLRAGKTEFDRNWFHSTSWYSFFRLSFVLFPSFVFVFFMFFCGRANIYASRFGYFLALTFPTRTGRPSTRENLRKVLRKLE